MRIYIAIATIFVLCFSCVHKKPCGERISFIVAADMRHYTTGPYRSTSHFLGVCEAIRRVGKGVCIVTPGDADPPSDVRKIITEVLGEEYPWYPVVGNHELDDSTNMVFLRNYNREGLSLPNIVRKGPPGCEGTTYSFDYDHCHFIVLNQYYDGRSDSGADGQIVPELLQWLEHDLAENDEEHIFVFGHEPMVAIPDMDNGRIRHQGDSLDKYQQQLLQFHQVLVKYGVRAYFCGHSHTTSVAKINGVWQVDPGHARGIEGLSPTWFFDRFDKAMAMAHTQGLDEKVALQKLVEADGRSIKKGLEYLDLSNGVSYKKVSDNQAVEALSELYSDLQKDPRARDRYIDLFWNNSNYSRSTFLKINVDKVVRVEVYRDDGRGGAYELRHVEILN